MSSPTPTPSSSSPSPSSTVKKTKFIVGLTLFALVATLIVYVVVKIKKYWPLIAGLGVAGLLLALGGPELLGAILGIPIALGSLIYGLYKKYTSPPAEGETPMTPEQLTENVAALKVQMDALKNNPEFQRLQPGSEYTIKVATDGTLTVIENVPGDTIANPDDMAAQFESNNVSDEPPTDVSITPETPE